MLGGIFWHLPQAYKLLAPKYIANIVCNNFKVSLVYLICTIFLLDQRLICFWIYWLKQVTSSWLLLKMESVVGSLEMSFIKVGTSFKPYLMDFYVSTYLLI